ncbi:MAG: hypothetical protein Q8O75_01810 [bacterium]|nr:hypothetical protein [bacterium]
MNNIIRLIARLIRFVWTSLKPIALIFIILVIIAASLLAYDQYRVLQEKQLGAKLVKNIDLVSACNDIYKEDESYSLKFTVRNKNNKPVNLEKIELNSSILGTEGKTYNRLLKTQPVSSAFPSDNVQFKTYRLENPLIIRANDKSEFTLFMQAASKVTAKATSHTIVIYKGKIIFDFSHEFSIETTCQIQVRYP